MKRIIILELCFLFLATTFQSDRMTGWVQQTIPRPDLSVKDLQFVDTLTGFMVSTTSTPDSAFIFKTTDGGNNWTTVVKDKLILFSIHFPSSQTGYSAGYSIRHSQTAVLKTTNGGENWDYILSINNGLLDDVYFVNNDTGWVCSNSGFTGGLSRTTNGGISWQMQMDYTSGPSKVFFVNSNTGWVIGSSDYKLYKTTNCGVNWVAQAVISGGLSDVFFASIDTGWVIGGSGNGILRSTNGGLSFHLVNNPPFQIDAKLFFSNSKSGWAGTGPNKIFATKDGYNWGTQSSPIWASYFISFADSVSGWAGASGLVHTTDGGGTIVSANEEKTEIPKEFSLEQNYPNPFNQSSIIQFKVQSSKFIKLVVYDLSGREVKTLVNEYKQAGTYQERFDAKDLPSGIYFYRLTSGDFSETKKMILTK